MTELELKQAYLAQEPPAALKERVLSACRAAKARRAALCRRTAAAAACFALVLALSVYGLSPVPAVFSDGQMVGAAPVAVTERTIAASEEPQVNAALYSDGPAAMRMMEPLVEGCIPLTFDRAVSVTVSAGTLYRCDPRTGASTDEGGSCKVEAEETLYWQCNETEAELTVRAGLRVRTLHLSADGGGRVLS